MNWKVQVDMGGQPNHGLWGSNVKTRKYLPMGGQEQISPVLML